MTVSDNYEKPFHYYYDILCGFVFFFEWRKRVWIRTKTFRRKTKQNPGTSKHANVNDFYHAHVMVRLSDGSWSPLQGTRKISISTSLHSASLFNLKPERICSPELTFQRTRLCLLSTRHLKV